MIQPNKLGRGNLVTLNNQKYHKELLHIPVKVIRINTELLERQKSLFPKSSAIMGYAYMTTHISHLKKEH